MLDVLWIIICPMEIKFLFPYGNEILISVPLKGYKLECFQNKIYNSIGQWNCNFIMGIKLS